MEQNMGLKFLPVSADVLSRFLRFRSMKTKTATYTTRAFKRMSTKNFPEKVWSDKRPEFKKECKQIRDFKNVELYKTHSETKSASAERNLRAVKKDLFWTFGMEMAPSIFYWPSWLCKQFYFMSQKTDCFSSKAGYDNIWISISFTVL